MDVLNTALPRVVNILLIVLLVVSIILVIKCIYLINKAKSIVSNVEQKVNSLNGIFNVMNIVSDKVEAISMSVVNFFEGLLMKFIKKDKDEERNESDEEE